MFFKDIYTQLYKPFYLKEKKKRIKVILLTKFITGVSFLLPWKNLPMHTLEVSISGEGCIICKFIL